jgi:hypothetical protein
MLNLTARIAVEIKNLPDWDVDWNDRTPQRDPHTLTISDLLPGEGDGVELKKRATLHIMHVLVEEFPALAHLQSLLPSSPERETGVRSNVVPMKILFKDEKYKSETIEILTQLVKDAEISEVKNYYYLRKTCIIKVVVGDQLTCKNIRGAKQWRASDFTNTDRLNWANEVPGIAAHHMHA